MVVLGITTDVVRKLQIDLLENSVYKFLCNWLQNSTLPSCGVDNN